MAERRGAELQEIFTSRHAEHCDNLRHRIADLDEDAAAIRLKIGLLQTDLEDATTERTAREPAEEVQDVGTRRSSRLNDLIGHVRPSALADTGLLIPRLASNGRLSSVNNRLSYNSVDETPIDGNRRPEIAPRQSSCDSENQLFSTEIAERPKRQTTLILAPGEAQAAPPLAVSPSFSTPTPEPSAGGVRRERRVSALDEEGRDSAGGPSFSPTPEPAEAVASIEDVAGGDLYDVSSGGGGGGVDSVALAFEGLEGAGRRHGRMSSVSPAKHRRMVEAKYREASCINESSIEHMKGELAELERRLQKQDAWTKRVEGEILKAEIAKARHLVRLEHSEKRCETLGQDLSKAYEQMSRLLDARMEVETMAAKNDALASYLTGLNRENRRSGDDFVDNKTTLFELLRRRIKAQECRATLSDTVGQVRDQMELSDTVSVHSAELMKLTDQLQQLWKVVEALRGVAGGPKTARQPEIRRAETCLPPTTAMHTVATAARTLALTQREHARVMGEFLQDGGHSLHRPGECETRSESAADSSPKARDESDAKRVAVARAWLNERLPDASSLAQAVTQECSESVRRRPPAQTM